MILVYLLIFVLTIIFITINLKEEFISYKRCSKKPLGGLTKEIFNNNEIDNNNDKWDVYIPCGYNGIENEMKYLDNLEEKQKIYGIDGCDKIVAKNKLWELIVDEYGFDEASKLMPPTYILKNNNDMIKFNKDFNSNNVYILKKNLQRKKGIKISNSLYEIENAKYDNYKLVQCMIESYLINNRKFNIRLYVLIIAKDSNIKVYLHKYNKLLYASNKVSKNRLDFDSNITNSYSVDKNIYESHPYNITELERLTKNDKIKYQMKDKLMKFCRAFVLPLGKLDSVKKNTKFQLFGIDALYDKNGDIYFLEINKGPDMKPKDDRDKKMKTKVLNDTFSKLDIIHDNHNLYDEIYSL